MTTRCYCGGSYTASNISHHKKTDRHMFYNRPAEKLLRDYYNLPRREQKIILRRIMGLNRLSDSDSDSDIII